MVFFSEYSKYGYSVHHYVLNNSLQTDFGIKYVIYFLPIQDGNLAFEVKFRVLSKDYTLTNIEMLTHPKVNLNMVRNS